MDPFLTEQIEQAIQKAGCETHRMASGAGHDAMILAERVPAAMIFCARREASVTIRQNQCIWTTSRKLSSAGIIC